MFTVRQAAEDIVKMLKTAYTSQTIRPVDEKAFAHLDLAAYARFREDMERDGYRFVSDVEIVELNQSPHTVLIPTMIRCMVSPDGETTAGYYQCRLKVPSLILNLVAGVLSLRFLWAPKAFLQSLLTKHCYDFESEIGATYVTTSSAADAAAMSRPSSVDAKYLDHGTPVTEVRTAHEARLATAVRRAGTTASPTKMRSYQDVEAMQERLKRVKDAHRAASGWITQSELLTLANGDRAMATAIFEEVQKILAERPLSPAA